MGVTAIKISYYFSISSVFQCHDQLIIFTFDWVCHEVAILSLVVVFNVFYVFVPGLFSLNAQGTFTSETLLM